MSFLTGLKIGASGLSAERVRMNVISSNIANVNTTRTDDADGGPYKRKDVLYSATNAGLTFDDLARQAFDPDVKEVKVVGVVSDQKPPKMVYNPNHPDANEQGYVAMPNISVMEEMVNLITSSRAFEANATSIDAIKSMANTAINIGRG